MYIHSKWYRCNARVHLRYLSCYMCSLMLFYQCFEHLSFSRLNDVVYICIILYRHLRHSKVPARIMRYSQAQVLYGIKGSKQSSQIKSCLVIFFFFDLFSRSFLLLFLDSKYAMRSRCECYWHSDVQALEKNQSLYWKWDEFH